MDKGGRDIEDMSGGELLDHVDALARVQRQAEIDILLAARQYAVLHGKETIPGWQLKAPGGERAHRIGGEGTPLVAEFSPAAFAARLGISPYAGRELIADALDLGHRLPRLWARVVAHEVKPSYARYVARKTRDLTSQQADHVDERVQEPADGSVPWSRFETLVEAAIVAADPAAARAREEAEANSQFARPTRADRHGIRGFYIRAQHHIVTKLDATVAYLAHLLEQLGDTSSLDERRVKAIAILANPAHALALINNYQTWLDTQQTQQTPPETSKVERPQVDWSQFLPAVVVYVHLYGGHDGVDGDGLARVEGMNPVTEAWVREHLGPHARFTIQPVHDIEGQAPIDGYEIPERHRQAVHLMGPADTFPYAANLSRDQQIDHTIPYRPGVPGQSRIGNYGKLTIRHHRIKTFSGWQVRQPFPGIYLWQDPYGAHYLVDHTGTRRLATSA
jgi:hypothetical protein